MWKAPHRPNNEITQSFASGVVSIFTPEDMAEPGYLPVINLTFRVLLRYEEQRLGIQRYYSGAQNQVEIERVIRVPRSALVSNQDVAITEDGHQYRIDMVQAVPGVYPPCLDLTLAKITQEYALDNNTEGGGDDLD